MPIVFVETTDPVDRGLVASLSRPGGNTTGFIQYEFAISGKWLELLKEIAPRVTHAAVIRDPTQFSGVGEVAAIQTIAPSLGVDVSAVDARDAAGIERAITEFARKSNGGVIVTPSGASIKHRDLIITLAAQQRLPAVYGYRYFVTGGGLISYGPYSIDQWRRAADYVDRILKGEKPADTAPVGTDQIRDGHQPEDCQGARPHRAANSPRPCRRGYRIAMLFAALHKSANGT